MEKLPFPGICSVTDLAFGAHRRNSVVALRTVAPYIPFRSCRSKGNSMLLEKISFRRRIDFHWAGSHQQARFRRLLLSAILVTWRIHCRARESLEWRVTK